MILKTEETDLRLSSTENLLNRLNLKINKNKPALAEPRAPEIPNPKSIAVKSNPDTHSNPPAAVDLIDSFDDKIALTSVKRSAVRIAGAALNHLEERLPEVSSPKALAGIVRDMGAVVNATEGIEKKRQDTAQIVIWQPTIISTDQFNSVNVSE